MVRAAWRGSPETVFIGDSSMQLQYTDGNGTGNRKRTLLRIWKRDSIQMTYFKTSEKRPKLKHN